MAKLYARDRKNWDMGTKWLYENDEWYRNPDKNKKDKLVYHYETDRMEGTRIRRLGEVPMSSCFKSTLIELAGKGVDVSGHMADMD